jgi:hypothetical protein
MAQEGQVFIRSYYLPKMSLQFLSSMLIAPSGQTDRHFPQPQHLAE